MGVKDEVKRSAEERLKALDAIERTLRGRSSSFFDDILNRANIAERQLELKIYPAFEQRLSFIDRFASSLAVPRLERIMFARFLFIYQFMDWDAADSLGFSQHMRDNKAPLKQIMTEIAGSNTMPFDKKLFWDLAQALEGFSRQIDTNKELAYRLIRKGSAYFNPIARTVLRATALHSIRGSQSGKRIGIFSGLGGGKTTLMIHSINTSLRILGMNVDEAADVTSKLIVNNPLEALEILDYITDTKSYLPAIALDDASSLVPSYWYLRAKAYKELVPKISNFVKRSREYFGVIFVPSDSASSIARSVRESIDYSFEGIVLGMNPVTTLWFSFTKDVEFSSSRPFGRKRAVVKARQTDWIGTVIPPMVAPDPIYNKLTEEKLKFRKQNIREAKKLAEELFGENGEKQEEEVRA